MSVKLQFCSIIILALLVVGCVAPMTQRQTIDPVLAAREAEKQRDLAVEDFQNNQSRIDNIGYRMLRDGVELCGDRLKPSYGFRMVGAIDADDEFQQAYRRLNNNSDQIHVFGVTTGFPAEVAGLKVGDAVLAINGKQIGTDMGVVSDVIAEFIKGEPGRTLTVTISRHGGNAREFLIVGESICDYGLNLQTNDAVNAFADGDNIFITSGMVRFAANDAQLAAVIGHEIAHNAMGHIDAKKTNALAGAGVGFLLDILAAAAGVNTGGDFTRIGMNAGAGAYSQEFESEADYVGLYLMARAGMDISKTPDFWRRMAVAHPAAIATNHGASHPPTPERFIALENTVREIALKISAGDPLMPEMTVAPAPRADGSTSSLNDRRE